MFYSFKGGGIVAATTFFRLQGDYLRSFVLLGIMKRFLYENSGLNGETTFYALYMIGSCRVETLKPMKLQVSQSRSGRDKCPPHLEHEESQRAAGQEPGDNLRGVFSPVDLLPGGE